MNAYVNRAATKLRTWGPDKCIAGVLAVLTFLVLVQGVRYGVTRVHAKGMTAVLRSSNAPAPARDETDDFEHYKPILDKAILGKGEQKSEPPLAMVFGIMGRTALLGTSSSDAKPYEVGGEVAGGEKLVEIGTDSVVLEKDGNRRTATIYEALDKAPKQKGPPPPPRPEKKKEEAPPPEQAPAPQQALQVVAPAPSVWVITAETIIGTRWSFQGSTVAFHDNGRFTVDDQIEGTYSIDGDTLTANVMDEEITAQIDGDKFIIEGNVIERDQ